MRILALVVDAGARIVMRWEGHVPERFDTAQLPAGNYSVVLRTDEGVTSAKLVVQH